MRFMPFFAAFLSVCILAAPPAHADAPKTPAAAPAPAAKSDAKPDAKPDANAPPADGGSEFDSAPPQNAAFMDEKDPDKPPPLDEYNNIPVDLMIPTEAAAMGEGPQSTLTSGSGKLTYENLMKMYKDAKYDDVAKALEPLAKGGHVGAQELMGIMYRYGQGVPKDPKKAYDYLADAANANRPLAQYHLGTMYYSGEGVQADSIMALMWIQIAIVHFPDGDKAKEDAEKSRDSLYTHLTRREKDRALQMAREWLTKRGEAHLLDLEGL